MSLCCQYSKAGLRVKKAGDEFRRMYTLWEQTPAAAAAAMPRPEAKRGSWTARASAWPCHQGFVRRVVGLLAHGLMGYGTGLRLQSWLS